MLHNERLSNRALQFALTLHNTCNVFSGASTGDLVRSILEDQPPPVPAHYSLGIKLVASELLHKDMSLRMGMAGNLIVFVEDCSVWGRFLNGIHQN